MANEYKYIYIYMLCSKWQSMKQLSRMQNFFGVHCKTSGRFGVAFNYKNETDLFNYFGLYKTIKNSIQNVPQS